MPSFVYSHLSVDSFQRIETFVDVPLSISNPAFRVGASVTLLFKTRILSSTVTEETLTETVLPLTVRSPVITRLPSTVTLSPVVI